AVNLAGEARVVAEGLGGAGNVDVRGLEQGLAVVERLELGELFGMLLDQVGDLEQEAGARMRSQIGPLKVLEGLARVLDGLVHVGLVTLGDQRQNLLISRVESLESFAGFRRHPFAVDEKFFGRALEELERCARLGAASG